LLQARVTAGLQGCGVAAVALVVQQRGQVAVAEAAGQRGGAKGAVDGLGADQAGQLERFASDAAAARSRGRARARSMAARSPSTSPDPKVSASVPSWRTDGAPASATIRAPDAAASSATRPKVSWRPGMQTTRALAYSRARRSRSLT